MLPGYDKPYRRDISDRRGGLLVYIKSHLPSRLSKTKLWYTKWYSNHPFSVEFKERKMYVYRPPSQNRQYFLDKLSEIIDHHSSIYEITLS